MSEAPDAIGRYKIVNRIGQGGMGVLFLAFDPMLERQVAIKLLRDDNDELRERFSREARSVARLRHPHIVTIFDVGEQDGHPFIAMEYLLGQTLADVIRGALPLDVPRKLQVIDELCDGLSFAHKAGIVHRDVKPANVMVEHDGVVKILDFGIARIAESGMTQAGMLIGTLNYMSPEQVAGQIVDGRSDIFAVGAVLYELLAYRQAFPGGLQNGILNKIMHGQPVALETVCPGLDAEVIRIVDRALQKDPDQRYQDLQAMRKDLQRAKQRLEQNLPETVALRPEDAIDTIGGAAPTTPARRVPQTPRWGTDRDGLAKRRATQTAAHLGDAQKAMETGDFDAAVVAAEQALLLNAEEPEAQRILERARQALDDRQLKEWLARGADLLQLGQHTEALQLAEHALTLAPGSTVALELRRAIDQARAEREQFQQRARAIQAAMDRGRDAFERQAYDEAAEAAGEALALSPEHADAASLHGRAIAASERQRQAALDRQVTEILAQAEGLFAEGRHDDGIAVLANAGLDDPRLAGALEEMQARATRLAEEAARIAREEEEARRRAEAIAEAVARAKAETSHEAAIAILTDALALDPARTEVRGLLEIRHASLEIERETARRALARDEQIAAMLERAAGGRSHEVALGILKEAQALDPARSDIRDLIASRQTALDAEREEARRVAERQQKVADAIAKASRTKAHEAAIAILEQAAALDPEHAGTRALLAERRSTLEREREEARRLKERQAEEARRLKERQETIAAAVARAAATPGHEAAVGILREAVALDANHAAAREALEKRSKALDREREEARKLRERQEHSAAALARAGATASHEAAIAILTEALGRDPGHAEITQALGTRRKALEEEARLARERREQVAAALAKAKATPAHDAAIAVLKAAMALDPGNGDLRQAIEARQAALTREQDEARRAREREERIASAIANAKKMAAHEPAIAVLNEALELDPKNKEVRSLLDARKAALDKEREQARLEAERQAKIASIIKQAKSAKTHEGAIALLNEALALDAANREARPLLESRTQALEAERAEFRRVQELEATRQAIAGLIERGDVDGAEKALEQAEPLLAKKTVKDLRRQLRDAQRAKASAEAAARTGSPDSADRAARSGGIKPATIGIAAAVVLAIAAGGYLMTQRPAPSTPSTVEPPVTTVPPSGGVQPPGDATAAKPAPTPPGPATTSVEPPATPEPVPAPVPANDPAAALVARAVQLGRQQLAKNDLRQALGTAAAGLKTDATNAELRRLESDIVATARQQAAGARAAAAGRGDLATGSGPYKGAQGRESEGMRLQKAGRSDPAVRAFLEATDLYTRADREAQQRANVAPPVEPAPRPTPPDVTPPAPTRTNPPAEPPVNPPVTTAPPPVTAPSPPPATATPSPKPVPPAPAAVNPAVNDEELIRATLRAYAAAYSSLDVAAVQRVFPSINAAAIARSFADLRSQMVQIDQEQITVSGGEATVRCRVQQSFVPKAGSGRKDTLSATFQLRKVGNQWLIASRR